MTENFFNLKTPKETQTYTKPVFLNMDYGQHLVRILGKPLQVYIHWIPKANLGIRCLGEECPVCETNKKIILENPDNFRRESNYFPRSSRHYINVLDKSSVKVCPECQHENKRMANNQYPAVCKCGSMIAHIPETISNKVKVVNLSETTAAELNAIHTSILDEKGDIIGINNFDILFVVTKVGDKKKISVVPITASQGGVEVPEESLYNLNNVPLTLSREEIIELVRGTSLRDIFAARNSVNKESEEPSETKEFSESTVKELVDSLYTQGSFGFFSN